MKYILSFIKESIRESNKNNFLWYFLPVLCALVVANYAFNLEKKVIASIGNPTNFLFFRLLEYSIPYYATAIAFAFVSKQKSMLNNKMFWIKSGLAILLLAVASWLNYQVNYILVDVDLRLLPFARKIFFNLIRWLVPFVPLLIFYWLAEKEKSHFYGLFQKHFSIRPYIGMMLFMLPLIYLASLHPSFLVTYPIYKPGMAEEAFNIPMWKTIAAFESIYAINFITVELVFRGFLVIGLARIMGQPAILPMVAFYAVFHFGKPMGETFGSIAGGFILGAIAFHTRSIIGGILIHVGVALGMDFFAFLQWYPNK